MLNTVMYTVASKNHEKVLLFTLPFNNHG